MAKKARGELSDKSRTTTFTDVWLQQEKMSQDDIFLGIAASVGGGSDTSYVAIVNIIHLLDRHPSVRPLSLSPYISSNTSNRLRKNCEVKSTTR
jgi:cytochrome P450